MGDDRHTLGRRGEAVAVEHLRRRGCAVLARNVRTRHGEIDVVVREHDAIVFVEVKTRRAGTHGTIGEHQRPLAGLGPRQRARLRRLAAAWLAQTREQRRPARTIRFDAIGVVLDARGRVRALEHVKDAW